MKINKKQIFVIIGTISVICLLFYSIISYLLNIKKDNKDSNSDSQENLVKSRESIIHQLEKDIFTYESRLKHISNEKIATQYNRDIAYFDVFDSRILKEKNLVLVNFAYFKFRTGGYGINGMITKVAQKNDGINKNLAWKDLKHLYLEDYKNRAAYSLYLNGYILHVVSLRPDDLRQLGLSIDKVSDFMCDLILRSIYKFEDDVGKESLIINLYVLPYKLLSGIFIDCEETVFHEKEFAVRFILGIYMAQHMYRGKNIVVINKIH